MSHVLHLPSVDTPCSLCCANNHNEYHFAHPIRFWVVYVPKVTERVNFRGTVQHPGSITLIKAIVSISFGLLTSFYLLCKFRFCPPSVFLLQNTLNKLPATQGYISRFYGTHETTYLGKTGLHTKSLVVLVNEHAHLRKHTALKSTRGLINNPSLWLLQLLLWMIPASCTVRQLGKNPTRLGELLAVETFIPGQMITYHVSKNGNKACAPLRPKDHIHIKQLKINR